MPKAAGKWNVYEITAQGPHLVVVLNGEKTADVQDSKHLGGSFALAWSNSARCRSRSCRALKSRSRRKRGRREYDQRPAGLKILWN